MKRRPVRREEPGSSLSDARPWDVTAAGRDRWFHHIEDAYGAVSQRLLDLGDIRAGSRVLDLGTGFGEPAMAASSRAGPVGKVVGTDISSLVLSTAKRRAAETGLNNIDFVAMDAEALAFRDGSFDSVLSRLMFMFLRLPENALSEARRVLVQGGRFAAAVLGPPSKTPLVFLWEQALSGHPADRETMPGDCQPASVEPIDPFSLSEPECLAQKMERAGFSEIRTETAQATFCFSDLNELVCYLSDTRADVKATFQSASTEERSQIVRRLGDAVAPYRDAQGALRLVTETNLVTATAPSMVGDLHH